MYFVYAYITCDEGARRGGKDFSGHKQKMLLVPGTAVPLRGSMILTAVVPETAFLWSYRRYSIPDIDLLHRSFVIT